MTDNEEVKKEPSLKEMRQFERWRKSLQYITGLGMSEDQRREFRDQLDILYEKEQHKQCLMWRDHLIKNSPPVRFMMEHINKLGGNITREDFLCEPCHGNVRTGGYSPDGGILLCQNKLVSKSKQECTMVHEMVHMHDNIKFDIDWSNLKHHACAEIRAASLSGDCRWTNEIGRRIYTFTKQHQACVKRRAILSVMDNPNCASKEEAERAVMSVFDSCFADTRPFDEIY